MKTRPYFVEFAGQIRCIESSSPSAAIAHCTKPLTGDVRVPTLSEIGRFCNQGGVMEIAGQYDDNTPGAPLMLGGRILRAGDLIVCKGNVCLEPGMIAVVRADTDGALWIPCAGIDGVSEPGSERHTLHADSMEDYRLPTEKEIGELFSDELVIDARALNLHAHPDAADEGERAIGGEDAE